MDLYKEYLATRLNDHRAKKVRTFTTTKQPPCINNSQRDCQFALEYEKIQVTDEKNLTLHSDVKAYSRRSTSPEIPLEA